MSQVFRAIFVALWMEESFEVESFFFLNNFFFFNSAAAFFTCQIGEFRQYRSIPIWAQGKHC